MLNAPLAQVLPSHSNMKKNPIAQLLCMEMVHQIKDNYLSQPIWLHCGNCLLSMCVKIMNMPWEQANIEEVPFHISIRDSLIFPELRCVQNDQKNTIKI